MLTLEKSFDEENELAIYTIKIDDGQQLSINEHEMRELLDQI